MDGVGARDFSCPQIDQFQNIKIHSWLRGFKKKKIILRLSNK